MNKNIYLRNDWLFKAMTLKREKRIIGRRETVSFPDLNVFGIIAKIDTGAYTTALHCHDIVVKDLNGIATLCFNISGQEERYRVFNKKKVKNSFGDFEERYVIKTKIKIAKRTINSYVSLTDRANMRYPVLIGRKLLKNRFIVDVSELQLWD